MAQGWLECCDLAGNQIWFNVNNIVVIQTKEKKTFIKTIGGCVFIVMNVADEIVARLCDDCCATYFEEEQK